MTRLFDEASVKKATGGQVFGRWVVEGISIDSRTIKKGDLFIAIKGENFDGHNFVKQALEKGAAAVVIQEKPEKDTNMPCVVVNDTLKALEDLGRYSRDNFEGKIVAVTGSVGKTSTKEMIRTILHDQGSTFASEGNLNNHFGVPLSLSRMPDTTEFGIFELGMNHAGEITPLSKMVRPDVAIITTVDAVHLEFFNSVAEIADAKAEIFAGMDKNGTAVLNMDNEHYERLVKCAKNIGIINIISFGSNEKAYYRLLKYEEDGDIPLITASINGIEYEYKLGITGKHQALNSLAALAAIKAVGANLEAAFTSLASFEARGGRGKKHNIKIDSTGDIIIVDDSYNASPASIGAAIENLSNLKKKHGGRSVALLGSMFELGNDAPKLHRDLSKKLVENGIDVVFTAGDLMKNLYDDLPSSMKGGHFANSDELAKSIKPLLKNGDNILVKGSRGMRMEKIVNFLLGEKGAV